jgi:hypothetical protein
MGFSVHPKLTAKRNELSDSRRFNASKDLLSAASEGTLGAAKDKGTFKYKTDALLKTLESAINELAPANIKNPGRGQAEHYITSALREGNAAAGKAQTMGKDPQAAFAAAVSKSFAAAKAEVAAGPRGAALSKKGDARAPERAATAQHVFGAIVDELASRMGAAYGTGEAFAKTPGKPKQAPSAEASAYGSARDQREYAKRGAKAVKDTAMSLGTKIQQKGAGLRMLTEGPRRAVAHGAVVGTEQTLKGAGKVAEGAATAIVEGVDISRRHGFAALVSVPRGAAHGVAEGLRGLRDGFKKGTSTTAATYKEKARKKDKNKDA